MNLLGLAAALTGFLAVALGAFGAHALEPSFSAEQADWWKTGTQYALAHSVIALAIALSRQTGPVRAGGWAFIAGTVIFGGTLYALALGAPRWTGAITPIGGISLLAGWAMCALGALRDRIQEKP